MEKICTVCKLLKSEEKFSWYYKDKNIRQPQCKECRKIIDKRSISNNRERYLARKIKARARLVNRNREYVINYLKNHSCIDCSETDILVLDFDHLKNKYKTISRMIQQYSIEKIELEIEKCVVRCANCHRRKTAKDFNWSKTRA